MSFFKSEKVKKRRLIKGLTSVAVEDSVSRIVKMTKPDFIKPVGGMAESQ